MDFFKLLPLIFIAFFVLSDQHLAQSQKTKVKSTKVQKALTKTEKQKADNCLDIPKDDVSSYAPIRFVIVYNYVFDQKEIPERRIEILLRKKI